MAKIKSPATVDVELTPEELALICRGLGLVLDVGEMDDWDAAGTLRDALMGGIA